MQSETERTFRNLKVIASLKQNEKLITEGPIFEIHPPTMGRSLWRVWRSEGRERNFDKIQCCIREAKNFIEKTVASTEQSDTFCGQLHLITQAKLSQRVMLAMEDAIPGLDNVAVTYREDAGVLAKIDLIKEEINDFIIATRSILARSQVSNQLA